jgi:DNA-binding CsgD family transcriptional regulator
MLTEKQIEQIELIAGDNLAIMKALNIIRKQLRVIDLLALGNMSIREIAKTLMIDRRTIFNWRKNKDFKEELEIKRKWNY